MAAGWVAEAGRWAGGSKAEGAGRSDGQGRQGAGGARGARQAGTLGQHVPAAQPLLLPPLLQAALQKPQLPAHRLLHGWLQLQHFLQVRLGLRLVPHLRVSPGPHVVGLHDACREDWLLRSPGWALPVYKPLTLTLILNLLAPPNKCVSSNVNPDKTAQSSTYPLPFGDPPKAL